jgi:hypothetical protein
VHSDVTELNDVSPLNFWVAIAEPIRWMSGSLADGDELLEHCALSEFIIPKRFLRYTLEKTLDSICSLNDIAQI